MRKVAFNTGFFLFIFFNLLFSQQFNSSEYQFISPVPGSSLNQPETNIIIRYGQQYNTDDILAKQVLEVKGEKSGIHTGRIKVAENNKTILFIPDNNFAEGETVTVKLISPVTTIEGKLLPELNFSFRISGKNLNKNIRNEFQKYFKTFYDSEFNTGYEKHHNAPQAFGVNDTLPEDFPVLTVNVNDNPAWGNIFLSPFTYPAFSATYLIIADNFGTPVFYRKMTYPNFDFKKQSTGVLSYYEHWQFYVLDSSYNIIDSLSMQNGYSTDVHELVILENNHALMMSYDAQQVAMDTVVPGGDPNATVIGLVIQELDENKDVVFQWRSWDHFQITDATYDIDLTASTVDYVHGNAIEMDYDGNILISSRHLDEITKINRQTGNIIWRLGGEHCENNQFTFINDSIGFSHQHDIRRLPNGNITLFDNGNLHNPAFSRGVEYQLDEINKYAQLISDYRNNPQTFSWAMGSCRRLENHNTFLGWGSDANLAMSEVKFDGSLTLSISLPDTMLNYRAFKFPWKTNLFATNPETVFFGYVPVGDSLEKPVEIINNSGQQLEINNLYNRHSAYSTDAALPILIPAYGTETIYLKFKPDAEGDYYDDFHLRWNKASERIARVVKLIGSTDSNFTSVEFEPGEMNFYLSQNYPNPFNPTTTISWQSPVGSHQTLKVYDILGREIAILFDEYKPAGSYKAEFNATGLPSGIYFYRIQMEGFVQTKKMILLR